MLIFPVNSCLCCVWLGKENMCGTALLISGLSHLEQVSIALILSDSTCNSDSN